MNRQQRRAHLKAHGIFNKPEAFMLFKNVGEFIKLFNLADKDGLEKLVIMKTDVKECLNKGTINAKQYRTLIENLDSLELRVRNLGVSKEGVTNDVPS